MPLATSLRSAALLLLVPFGIVTASRAQVVVHPHRIFGEVRFSNVHPEIRAEIERAPATGDWHWEVVAQSYLPAMTSTTRFQRTSRASLQYEMTVEGSDAGVL